jgi:nucleotide sugar dehydrogenase
VKGTKEAELTKLLENTFRHVNIALINELAMHARSLGIDMWDAIEAAKTKPFGFMPFFPGPGVGGHCLPVDPTFLSWRFERQLGASSRFVDLANDINQKMPDYVVSRIQAGLNDRSMAVKGAKVLVLGVAYKPNSNDARETPATGVIEGLLALGAEVLVHDCHVDHYELDDKIERVAELDADFLAGCDAVVLVTDHDDVDYDLIEAQAPYIFDARHRLSADSVEQF